MKRRGRIRSAVLGGQEVALCAVRKWWRPLTCVGIAGGSIVNLVVIPLWTMAPINMVEAAAYVTACAAAFAVREVGKRWGTVETPAPPPPTENPDDV